MLDPTASLSDPSTDGSVLSLRVRGMMCENCTVQIRKALSAAEGVRNVEVDMEKEIVNVSGRADPVEILQRLEEHGYLVYVLSSA